MRIIYLCACILLIKQIAFAGNPYPGTARHYSFDLSSSMPSGHRSMSSDVPEGGIQYVNSILWSGSKGIHIEGDYIYVAKANGLQIFDITNPSDPVLIRQVFIPNPSGKYGYNGGMYKSGDYVYYCRVSSNVTIIDVSTPTSATIVSEFNTYPGTVIDVFVLDQTMYVADMTGILHIVDVSDPSSPQGIAAYPTPPNTQAVCVADTLAYLISDSGLSIMNVVDTGNPTYVSTVRVGHHVLCPNLIVENGMVFIPDLDTLRIIDATNPVSPVPALEYEINVYDVFVDDTLVYVSGHAHEILSILNIADIGNLVIVGTYDAGGGFISADNNRIGLFSNDIHIVDVSNPTSPSALGIIETPQAVSEVATVGTTVLVPQSIDGLCVYDIGTLSHPYPVSVFEQPTHDVFVQNDRAYVITHDSCLHILDISDPSSPDSLGTYRPFMAMQVYAQGSIVYMVGVSGMQMVDVSNPTDPQPLGSYLTLMLPEQTIMTRDSLLFMGSGSSGLYILDVSDPMSPQVLSHCDSCLALDIQLRGDYAYIAGASRTFYILDISDPLAPTIIGSYYEGNTYGTGIALQGDLAFLAVGNIGLLILDVSDPTNPEFFANMGTPGSPHGIVMSDDLLFFVDRYSLLILRNLFELEKPDLTLSIELTHLENTYIYYDYIITNIGDAPADLDGPTEEEYDNVSIQNFLSPDTIWGNQGDVLAGGSIIGLSPLGELLPGESRGGSFYAVIPDTLASLPDYVVAKIDHGNSVEESDETNNFAWALVEFQPEARQVFADIKPGSCPNPLNLKGNHEHGKAVFPVAVLGTDEFSVADIDPSTVMLEGIPAVRWSYEDVGSPYMEGDDNCACDSSGGPDGIEDLALKFYRADIVAELEGAGHGDIVPLTLTGMLYDSTTIEGTDCVWIRNGGKPENASAILLSDEVILHPNSPNPFNPVTRIAFDLPEAMHVRLDVFNVLGQKVATIVDQQLEAGIHDYIWNAGNAASGLYFYRLTTPEQIKIRKMLLLK